VNRFLAEALQTATKFPWESTTINDKGKKALLVHVLVLEHVPNAPELFHLRTMGSGADNPRPRFIGFRVPGIVQCSIEMVAF
jgi:hypothetical protein